jgi:hypothetical protein
MNNEIVIKSVYGKVNQIYFIQPCPNPKTGKLPNCVRTVDSNGDMILAEEDVRQMSAGVAHFVPANKVFEIVDGTVFNLDDIVDKAHWESIQHCNWIAKDRFERDSEGNLVIDGGARRYGVADLYVERPGEITAVKMSKKELIFKASQYVWEDTETERLKKCRVLGRNLENAPKADVLDYLISIAEKTPKKIIDLYEGEDWKMQLFILDAVDRGVIRKNEGLYKYDDKLLGGSMEATITFLRDIRYKKLLDSIKRETYPNLLPKQEIAALEDELTSGIPHFDDSLDNPGEVEASAPKPAKSKGIVIPSTKK